MFGSDNYMLCACLQGTEAAFSPVGLNRSGRPKVCTSVSVFIFRGEERVCHVLLDVGPGVTEAIQEAHVFPRAFPLDWLILSHSHPDHWLGLDALCGDYYRHWARGEPTPPSKLRLLCMQETFEQTIVAHFPYLTKKLDYTPSVLGVPFTLWTDGTAKLELMQVEVKHFRRSVVNVFLFNDGKGKVAKVVCLFDIEDFHPLGSDAAKAGARPDNPIFYRPDLLIAEANTYTLHETGHICFIKLADYIGQWLPRRTRIIHYGAYEDMLPPNNPSRYWEMVAQGKLIHPSSGPVSEWVLSAAIQAELHGRGFPEPLSVSVGAQGETLVVDPTMRRNEQLLRVRRPKCGGLEVEGHVSRNDAHRYGIPHTTVLLLPTVSSGELDSEDRIVVHWRSTARDVSGGKCDACGGHLGIEGPMLDPENWKNPAIIESHVKAGAVREAIEEIVVIPAHYFTCSDLVQIGGLGDFSVGDVNASVGNVEFSTLFVVRLPPGCNPNVSDSGDTFRDEACRVELYTLDELLGMYKQNNDKFADGLGRVLHRLLGSPALQAELRQALKR